jgi:hypothetical protein
MVVIAMLALVFARPAGAEELSPEKQADIERLLEVTGALAVGQQMSSAVVGQLVEALKASRADIPDRVLDLLPAEVDAVIAANLPSFKAAIVPLYHKYFSAAEIKELIRFYSSAVGRKAVGVMPALVQESMSLGQRWGASLAPQIDRRVKERLKREGIAL